MADVSRVPLCPHCGQVTRPWSEYLRGRPHGPTRRDRPYRTLDQDVELVSLAGGLAYLLGGLVVSVALLVWDLITWVPRLVRWLVLRRTLGRTSRRPVCTNCLRTAR